MYEMGMNLVFWPISRRRGKAMGKRYSELAVAFASALVQNDLATAQSLLVPALREQLTPDRLRQQLYAMFRGYAHGEPRKIQHDESLDLDEWPTKQPGDVGWAYIGIEGDDFVEAVSVTVADVSGQLLIRDVEWGRP